MTEISLILKIHGWKTHTKSTLLCWKKKRLIEEIQILENNYACELEMNDNQANLLLKMYEENEQLKNENETLKKQFEKFLDKTIENNEQLIAKCDNILDKI